MINFIAQYQVIPSLPKQLEKLRELAYNLYWSWSHETRSLFRRMDRDLWEGLNHNPVLLLGKISQQRLEELSSDDGFISQMNHAYDSLQQYLKEQTWFAKNYNSKRNSILSISQPSLDSLSACKLIREGLVFSQEIISNPQAILVFH